MAQGPLKKARAHVQRERRPLGVTRSNVEPNETRGLARSGDLSSLLPSEAAMLAGARPPCVLPRNVRGMRHASGWALLCALSNISELL